MKKTYYSIYVTFLFFLWGCKTTDSNELVGRVTFLEWKNSNYWYEESYRNYTVDLNKADLLASKLDSVNYIIFFANPDCGICRIEVPRIYKIIEALPKNNEKLQLIVLDEYNTEPTQTYKYYGVRSTPTIVIVHLSNKTTKFSPKFDILSELIENI